jgi:cytochrome c peroxidase
MFVTIRRRWKIAGVGVAILTILAIVQENNARQGATNPPNTGMADPVAFMTAFDRFVSALPAGAERVLVIPLTGLRGLVSESFNAGGSLTIDFADGSVRSRLTGLPSDADFDLWLVDNIPSTSHSTLADPGDVLIRVGAYQETEGALSLEVVLGRERFAQFMPDRAFVVRSNQTPLQSFVLTGSATIFDRLYRRQVRIVDNPTAPSRRTADFARLVAEGRRLFVKEKFEGNGRACATCHVESNNFTIDPAFIATLPANDPLFVAETNPALAADFEKPDLMRRFGLILENVDGLDDLRNKFTMRSTQTVLALANSTVRPDPTFIGPDFTNNGRNPDPPERLGWGNDALPLRDFAIGAIAQHATRTLNRKAGFDFRVPTDEELDALAAYQLALGRQEDFNLKSLELKSTIATTGKTLFLDTGVLLEPGRKNCNACHFNAGGTTGMAFNPSIPDFSPLLDGNPRGFNMSAATGVNSSPESLALGIPRDGGFGTIFLPATGGFGNEELFPPFGLVPFEEFNSPSLVESADTAPFFHDHSGKDIEAAVAFYGTPPFQDGIGHPVFGLTPVKISADPNDPEVQAISAFLRVLNALENIRSSISLAERGRAMAVEDAQDLASLALAEVIDASEVLSEGALARNREAGVLSARANLSVARVALELGQRFNQHWLLENALEQAARSLRAARSALANQATLPQTFRT